MKTIELYDALGKAMKKMEASSRNLASHIYKEEIANDVYNVAIGDFLEYVTKLFNASAKYIGE